MVVLGGVYVEIHWRLGSLEKRSRLCGWLFWEPDGQRAPIGLLLVVSIMLIALDKITEREGSISSSNFYGHLPTISHTC